MSEQMRECPCCSGGVGMVWTRHAFDVSYEPVVSYKVQCRECRLSTKDYPTEAEAIAAWNQRAESDMEELASHQADDIIRLQAEVKRLQEILGGWQVENYGDY